VQAAGASAHVRHSLRPLLPRSLGDGLSQVAGDSEGDDDGDGEQPEIDLEALRALLRDVLLNGDPTAIARLAAQAVASLGRADSSPGRQTWFTYRVLRQLTRTR